MDNPYTSPLAPSSAEALRDTQPIALSEIARSTFLAWEKLRLVYIAVLAAVTLLAAAISISDPASFLGSFQFFSLVSRIVGGAVVANLCYFAGPIVDTYVTWLGFRTRWFRISLFVVGTLFASVLAFALVANKLLGMD